MPGCIWRCPIRRWQIPATIPSAESRGIPNTRHGNNLKKGVEIIIAADGGFSGMKRLTERPGPGSMRRTMKRGFDLMNTVVAHSDQPHSPLSFPRRGLRMRFLLSLQVREQLTKK